MLVGAQLAEAQEGVILRLRGQMQLTPSLETCINLCVGCTLMDKSQTNANGCSDNKCIDKARLGAEAINDTNINREVMTGVSSG